MIFKQLPVFDFVACWDLMDFCGVVRHIYNWAEASQQQPFIFVESHEIKEVTHFSVMLPL